MEKLRTKAFWVKTVKGIVRVRTIPLPWQTLCQVLEALRFSPAQWCSGGSVPGCWGRENIKKDNSGIFLQTSLHVISESGWEKWCCADCCCSWGHHPKRYWVCDSIREVVSLSLNCCGAPGVPPKHGGPPCCACAWISVFAGFSAGILVSVPIWPTALWLMTTTAEEALWAVLQMDMSQWPCWDLSWINWWDSPSGGCSVA